MQCTFVYKNQEYTFIPHNIIFQQSIHQYAQVYVICSLDIKTPEKLIINQLFTGIFIFQKQINSHEIALYFCNENIKINSNEFLYMNSFTNKIENVTYNQLKSENLLIYKMEYIINKHKPRYLEITHQYITDDDKIHRDIIFHEFSDGIGYKRIQFNSIDTKYIRTLIEHICINYSYIKIHCQLQYENIRIGDLITIDNKIYRILHIHHNFINKQTIIKCHNYIKDISFHFCDRISRKETIQEINSIEIITPECTENHYYIRITPNL